MPVELIFNAPTVVDLHKQVIDYADALRPEPVYTSPLVERDPVADMITNANKVHDTVVNARKKPTKIIKKTLDKPVTYPDPEPQPEPLGEPQNFEEWMGETVNGEVKIDEAALTVPGPADIIANEKLKAEVIARMQEWFAAGRVKLIREVLETYGDGAKSFPEIPAERFVKIDQAIKSGEIA